MMKLEKKDNASLRERYKRTIPPQARTGVWGTVEGFVHWAVTEGGYQRGAMLLRRVNSQEHSPGNSYFSPPTTSGQSGSRGSREEFIRAWNRAVNPLRIFMGLPPFPDPEEESEC